MLTRDAVGAVRVWRFVLGSATAGVRLYELRDGTRKRLTAPKNLRSRKKRKRADGGDGPSRGESKNGGSGDGGLTIAIDAVALRSKSDSAAELRSRLRIIRNTYLEDVEEDETLRTKINALLGRFTLGAMYLRAFAPLGAMVMAVSWILSDEFDVDSDVVVVLHLSQVLTASRRRAIDVHPAYMRERTVAVLQLPASFLAPMYAALKLFDPENKKAGVVNLYLHTALSHVRQSVGQAFATLVMVCDNNIEKTIAEMNR
ncbi:hypothetical protein BU14_0154s0005 [Porphyra umbilicalis]|uniref:Uncharacterized protein n=1 Tax=Porphyra umbilicalis TaxID=2786 RepID=A0A1X6P8K5_PORUM|nr:hypothetical protein BU14_0154s0005 [Porphyra umbilicalis]|eukprot:OSX77229.1 hypothetical protein BU14_0154s0005 [Porphyra umbilicalis]